MTKNYSKEDIFTRIGELLEAQFEVEAANITLEARLYDDLDIDSIDAIDLMIELKEFTVTKIKPEDFKDVETLSDVVDVVYRMSKAAD